MLKKKKKERQYTNYKEKQEVITTKIQDCGYILMGGKEHKEALGMLAVFYFLDTGGDYMDFCFVIIP